MPNPLVSIILPIYNQEQYLERSITSLFKQTYTRLEIIAVNDGSADGTQKLLDAFAAQDCRVRVISQENQGLVGAVCTGVRHATGAYICFVDPDDYVGERYIENFIQNIEEYDCVAMGYFVDNGPGVPAQLHTISRDHVYTGGEIDRLRNTFFAQNGRMSAQIGCARWNKMYRASCVQKMISSYESIGRISYGEDTLFNYFFLRNCSSVKALSVCNTYYYNTANSNSMMKQVQVEPYLVKSQESFRVFQKHLQRNQEDVGTAFYLYFFEIESLFQRLKNQPDSFALLYHKLKQDALYQQSLAYVLSQSRGIDKLKLFLRKYISSPHLFMWVNRLFARLK